MEVAEIIYRQIGGNKFKMMVGGTNFGSAETYLKFDFKMCKKANKCKIILTPRDVYKVEFYKLNKRTFDCPKVETFENVYFDQLQSIFTEYTGLYTSL